MPITINLNRLQILLAEMHCALPEGYNVAFIAMNANNPNAHVVFTDMKPEDILRTMTEAGMPIPPADHFRDAGKMVPPNSVICSTDLSLTPETPQKPQLP